ncbi:hypothetical protein SAMN04488134_107139 [Amphibacillus marinus]|uniref:Uncharacterized protein n=1 Tax=Amphibacillus marinus TaxID=872970 RepID=A0A1H8PPQ9_9BACI|nr:hypothetical protein [Amphibacillus marinus]SEO43741.1 hypothetical protein SAMN04488134_107139 [Amphibacillus marinus]
MIEISSATQHENIINLLNKYNEADITFSYKRKKGINLYFETSSDNLEAAAKIAKAAIKKETWGTVLYFRSVPIYEKV